MHLLPTLASSSFPAVNIKDVSSHLFKPNTPTCAQDPTSQDLYSIIYSPLHLIFSLSLSTES